MTTEIESKAMPKTPAPKLIDIKFGVPQGLYDQALKIAESEGWKESELHRVIWSRGLAAIAEDSNKRLVNDKLRKQQSEGGSDAES